ncbi:MAG TPA: hypothetical protein VG890_12185 [Puia sp.]|nr:hypothetical protein [Puia sp.]
MKNPLFFISLFIFLLTGSAACKKFIQQQEQNALEDLVTKGTWRITRYKDHQTDITPVFSGYVFQFRTNGTVDGISGSTTTTGTWVGDVSARTIQSDFPDAGAPLNKLNYTWKVTDSYTDSVSAKALVDSVYNYLELHKN